MTVIYDLLGVQSKDHGERGIARYVLRLAIALEETSPDLVDIYLVREDLPIPGVLEPLIRTGKVRTVRTLTREHPRFGVFIVASPFELDAPLDSLIPTWARTSGWKRCAVLYDLIPLVFPDIYVHGATGRSYMARTQTLASLDHLFAISEASKTDAVRLLNYPASKITMIGAGADARFAPPTIPQEDVSEDLRQRLPGIRDGYLLFPSGIEWRKNIDRTLTAYAKLDPSVRRRHQLVLVCRTNESEKATLAKLCADLGITEDFLATGFVHDDDLVKLYQAASLVVFPSLYEGFGLPVLEARRCGAPTICSDTSSLREVQPDPETRFDPYDEDEIAAVMLRSLTEDGRLAHLRTAPIPPFTWIEGAGRLASVVAEMAVLQTGHSRRLAVVSPLPPMRSGIANYTYRLVEDMARQVEVTVFVEGSVEAVEAPPGVRVLDIGLWQITERMEGAFDEVLYCLGNSEFHVHAVQMLRQRPGVVLFHDARMTGLYRMQAELTPANLPGGSVGALLGQLYPDRYRDYLYHQVILDGGDAERFGILLAKEIAIHATRVLAHSRFAASWIELDSGVGVDVLFPLPIPHPAGYERTVETVRPVIATFGGIDPIKEPALLVEAFALLLKEFPEAELRFLGHANAQQRNYLARITDEQGVSDSVSVSGFLSETQYEEQLQEASLSVQLRKATNGESSAAVSDAISHGLPVIVTALGAMTEYPGDVVVPIASGSSAKDLALAMSEVVQNVDLRGRVQSAQLLYSLSNSYPAAAQRLLIEFFPELEDDR